jgi:hypothetical protein
MAELDPQDPLLDAVLDGRYRITERIGAGGMGTVYRAWQLNVERDVAVKFLRADAYGDPRQVRRFEREARMIARLRDPHTLKLIDFGRRPDGQLYLVCEFLAGEPLDRRIARGPLAAGAALELLRPVCDALAEAHGEGIVHRDLKPGNLFVERVGARELIKVLDFGIAQWTEGEHSTTGVSGTPAYMAPEQARGHAIDHRCDLYALGAVLYACLSGRAPYLGSGLQVMLEAISGPPTPFDHFDPPLDVSPEVAAFVFRLMAPDPADRTQSAVEAAAEFDRLRGLASVRASTPALGLATEVMAETIDAGPTPMPGEWPAIGGVLSGPRIEAASEVGSEVRSVPDAPARVEPEAETRVEPMAAAARTPCDPTDCDGLPAGARTSEPAAALTDRAPRSQRPARWILAVVALTALAALAAGAWAVWGRGDAADAPRAGSASAGAMAGDAAAGGAAAGGAMAGGAAAGGAAAGGGADFARGAADAGPADTGTHPADADAGDARAPDAHAMDAHAIGAAPARTDAAPPETAPAPPPDAAATPPRRATRARHPPRRTTPPPERPAPTTPPATPPPATPPAATPPGFIRVAPVP